jgi:hypothetical protein
MHSCELDSLPENVFLCNFEGYTKKIKSCSGSDQHTKKCHLNQLKFKCDSCEKSFIYKCYLYKHIKEKHPNNNEEILKPYHCTLKKKCIRKNKVAFKKRLARLKKN